MQSNSFKAILICACGILLSAFVITEALSAGTSSISSSVKYVGGALALICLVNPRVGIYVISLEAFTLDYLKKVAVYYGNASTITIAETMVVVMLAVAATIAGMVMNSIFTSGRKLPLTSWLFLAAGLIWSGAALGNGIATSGIGIGVVQYAFNSGAYLALAGVIVHYFQDKESLHKFFDFQCVLALLSALWAFKQVVYGWSPLELYYAESGLSPVTTRQYYVDIAQGGDPRPTGFASGSKNLGYLAAFFVYAVYRVFLTKKKMFWYLMLAVVFAAAMIVSRQKAPIIAGAVAPIIAFCFRSRFSTIGLYLAGVIAFIAIVLNAESLRGNMTEIDQTVREGVNADTSYSLKTFSTRLDSYLILKDPKNWTYFGLDESVSETLEDHDIFSSFLINFGAVGLFSLLLFVGVSVGLIHRECWRVQDKKHRVTCFFFLGYIVVALAANFTGGSNLHTLPVNFVIWTFLGGLVVVRLLDKREQIALSAGQRADHEKGPVDIDGRGELDYRKLQRS